MGYYSEVQYVVAGPADAVMGAIATWRLIAPMAEKQLEEVDIVPGVGYREGQLLIHFYMDSGKWYSDYEDVQAHMCFLDSLNDNENIEAVFIRIGEEDSDIEQRTYGMGSYDLRGSMYITQSIPLDIDIDPNKDIRKQTEGKPCQLVTSVTSST